MDTIIVEVSDFNEHKGRMLGEHLWINVFKQIVRITAYYPISTLIWFRANVPWYQQVEDKQKSSKLYLCPLGNYLELEKQRWRETKVDPDWFKKPWNTNNNSMVRTPYPKTQWCDLPDHHGIDEFCGKIPLSLFPEEEAARAKQKEDPLPDNELSALTTPGAAGWNTARRKGNPIPTERVRPALDPASRPQPKQPITRTYRKVETVTTEQSMRAVLVPPMPKHLTLGENGLPNLEPEHFDWFEDVEDEDDTAEWRQQEPPNWELSQLSMEEQRSPAVAPSENGWNAAPSWDDESEAAGPVASSSNAPEQNAPPPSPPPTPKAQAWQRKSQPARNAWLSAAGGPKPVNAKPSPAQSNKSSGTEWQTPGKAKATPQASGGANRGGGRGRGWQKAKP